MKRVLVTGATGFVAAAAIPALQRAGWDVMAAVRRPADAARFLQGAVGWPWAGSGRIPTGAKR